MTDISKQLRDKLKDGKYWTVNFHIEPAMLQPSKPALHKQLSLSGLRLENLQAEQSQTPAAISFFLRHDIKQTGIFESGHWQLMAEINKMNKTKTYMYMHWNLIAISKTYQSM